jgi:hypothetical protein
MGHELTHRQNSVCAPRYRSQTTAMAALLHPRDTYYRDALASCFKTGRGSAYKSSRDNALRQRQTAAGRAQHAASHLHFASLVQRTSTPKRPFGGPVQTAETAMLDTLQHPRELTCRFAAK